MEEMKEGIVKLLPKDALRMMNMAIKKITKIPCQSEWVEEEFDHERR